MWIWIRAFGPFRPPDGPLELLLGLTGVEPDGKADGVEDEPKLRAEVNARLPRVDLPEVLLEIRSGGAPFDSRRPAFHRDLLHLIADFHLYRRGLPRLRLGVVGRIIWVYADRPPEY